MFWQTPPLHHPQFLLHALATPLTTVLLNCELLTQNNLSRNEAQNCLINMQCQQQYLKQLMSDGWANALKPFNLQSAVAEVVIRHHRPFAGERVYVCSNLSPTTPPRVLGNQLLFQEMLSCLVKNSLESYTETTSKRVAIVLTQRQSNFQLTISDSGQGWSHLRQWQTRWLRRSHKTGHHGIGWLFCHQVIKRFQGKIHVVSQPKIGTTITLTLGLSNQNLERF